LFELTFIVALTLGATGELLDPFELKASLTSSYFSHF
jgi:hypothetical protein